MVAGNLKMHGSHTQIETLLEAIRQEAQALSSVDIVVLPSFVYLQQTQNILSNPIVEWGAQNLYLGISEAFTGEESGAMLVDFGCQYVLVGHSESRHVFNEDLALVAAKFKAAIDAKLQPILCLGETLEERKQGETKKIISQQLESVIQAAEIKAFRHAVIAYEPIWAIDAGSTATPEEAQDVHAIIRKWLGQYDSAIANTMRILYGGRVEADNAADLFRMADIDGVLVGGEWLEAKSFLAICQAAC
jgi:triosephosphate isomerase